LPIRAAPRAEQDEPEYARADHRRIDRAAPLPGPVDVVEVDPQGELVDGEADAHPEEEGADLVKGTGGKAGEAERPATIIVTISNTRSWMCTPLSLTTLPGHQGTLGLRIRRVLMRMKANEPTRPSRTRNSHCLSRATSWSFPEVRDERR